MITCDCAKAQFRSLKILADTISCRDLAINIEEDDRAMVHSVLCTRNAKSNGAASTPM
jgi:hypothetical protein